MARLVFDGRQLDQNFQIEQGVKDMLKSHLIAEVAVGAIERCYELFDRNMDPTSINPNDVVRLMGPAGLVQIGRAAAIKDFSDRLPSRSRQMRPVDDFAFDVIEAFTGTDRERLAAFLTIVLDHCIG